jgi:hypothetical protein
VTAGDGYRARWRGEEYPASPDPRPEGLWIRLRRPTPAEGFAERAEGLHVRVVPVAEVEVLVHVRTVCRWRGEPFLVREEHGGRLLLEHTGGSVLVAGALGLERIARGVHRRWVDAAEVQALREDVAVLTTGVTAG